MVERHLKSLKALVRQRAHPKGSMVEGYMVYQSMVYIIQYIPKLATQTMHVVDCIWDVNSIKKFEVHENLLGKGIMKTFRGNILIIVEIYINTYNFLFFVYMIILINILIYIISSIINIYYGYN
jgi:hypothetical protein